ncbi:MAG: hypothetical protein KGV51_01810 [Moraxellaceae bacterium]|nr:hypothetical protein [Moraxellaceae bacterium]
MYANNTSSFNNNNNINLATNELIYEKEEEKQAIIEKKHKQLKSTKQAMIEIDKTDSQTLKKENNKNNQKDNLDIECSVYNDIEIVGATVINIEPFKLKAGECINKERINKLNRDIIRAYLQEGFARVTTSFSVQDKSLLLTINEGKVHSVSSNSSRLNVNMLFPNMVGKPLNIEDLDQGLDQTNYLNNTDASLDVYTNDDGSVDVAIANQSDENNLSGNVSIDNNGSASTGKWVGRVLVNADSPLNLSDKLTATASQSLAGLKQHTVTNKDKKQLSRSVGVNYSVPYGDLRLGAYGSVSDYHSPVELPNSGTHEQSGNSSQAGVNADLVVSRGQNHVSKLTANVEKYKSESYFDDSLIKVQSPEFNSAKVGVNHLIVQPSKVISLDGFYETNVDTYRQKKARKKANKRTVPDYNLYGLNADAYFYHDELKWIKARWRNQHNLKLRYAIGGLPTIKQDNLLSANSVRGFDDLVSNGEKLLTFQSTYFLTKRHKNWLIEPYIGMDFAVQESEEKRKTAIGGAIGVNASHKKQADKTNKQNYQINLEYAKGLLKEKEETTKADDVTMKLKWSF